MNTSLRTAVLSASLSLSLLGLSACAGMRERPHSTYVPPQRTPSLIDNDARYMATVERLARRRGIGLVWVNPPQARRHIATATGD